MVVRQLTLLSLWSFFLTGLGLLSATASTNDYFTIEVVDGQTGRGVPLVELRTVNKAAWWTDSGGIVAFDEPGLMDTEVYFHVRSPGYEYPSDGFGNRGVKLRPARGATATVKLQRLNIAERLYRITGQGIYRDSVLSGRPAPLKQPLLNGQVMGQDTVIATPYGGKIYWFWGDTDRASYPLGNFSASGATSELPGHGGLDPGVGVDLTYFVDASGFSKPMCPLPEGGLHWIESLFTLPDEHGRERLLARVAIVPGLAPATEWDLMQFNDDKQVFEPIRRWPIHDSHQSSHPFRARVEGTNFFYLFPDFRVPADLNSLADLGRYEAFSCLGGDGKWHERQTTVDREDSGRVRYAWRKRGDRVDLGRMESLLEAKKLRPDEAWGRLVDFETGAALSRGLESVSWNEFRRRWIAFFADKPGEVWFAEADTPLGPWGYGRRIVTHGDYNFYNIAHHPFFNQGAGRLVYFEGTYADTFSDARAQTPRYDYNQLMYRLALDDDRLRLPVAVYRLRGTNHSTFFSLREGIEAAGAWERAEEVAWFALPPASPGSNLLPIYAVEKNGMTLSLTPSNPGARPLFVSLPLEGPVPAPALAGSWDCRAAMPEGGELKFPLRFSLAGEVVRLEELDPERSGAGTFHDGKLALTLKTQDGTYVLAGVLEKQSLTGTWRQEDGAAKGTWSARPANYKLDERSSPALAILREYRRRADKAPAYSVQSEPPPGCEPAGRELCRVWKAPAAALLFDPKAKPISRSDD